MVGMAVTQASRTVSPSSAQFNPIPSPSLADQGSGTSRGNTDFNTIATPAVCSLKQQQSAAAESKPPETSQISDINELFHCFFILKTKIGMPSCTVVVLESHLAMTICTLGTPGRSNSLLHLAGEATWDHQQV